MFYFYFLVGNIVPDAVRRPVTYLLIMVLSVDLVFKLCIAVFFLVFTSLQVMNLHLFSHLDICSCPFLIFWDVVLTSLRGLFHLINKYNINDNLDTSDEVISAY